MSVNGTKYVSNPLPRPDHAGPQIMAGRIELTRMADREEQGLVVSLLHNFIRKLHWCVFSGQRWSARLTVDLASMYCMTRLLLGHKTWFGKD